MSPGHDGKLRRENSCLGFIRRYDLIENELASLSLFFNDINSIL
jgi:hypothetical protein